MIYILYLLSISFFMYKVNKYELVFFIILFMPSFVILIQYITNIPLIPMNMEIHTPELLRKGLIVYSIFLIFFKLGLLSARNKKLKILNNVVIIKTRFVSIFYAIIFIFLLILQRPSSTIYGGFRYGLDKVERALTINTIPIILFTILIFYLVKIITTKKMSKDYIYFTFLYMVGAVYYNFLMGYRVEALGFSIAIYFLLVTILSKKQNRNLTILMIILILFLWSLGFTRYGGVLTFDRLISSFSTFSHLSNSYLVCIDMVDNNPNYDLQGFTFLIDNLLSTLPASFTPIERPIPIATRISISEYTSTGGIYWFGSVYWSFGFFGVVYIYLFGFFLGILNNYREYIGTIGNYMFIISIMLAFRFLYYGGLSLYKGFIVLFLFLFILKITEIILKRNKGVNYI
jgi:hypothetical protein